MQTDKGTEFKYTLFQDQLTEYKIKLYTSENDDIKAAIVGRFNRTLKTRMYGYFTHSKKLSICRRVTRLCALVQKTILITVVLECHLPKNEGLVRHKNISQTPGRTNMAVRHRSTSENQ